MEQQNEEENEIAKLEIELERRKQKYSQFRRDLITKSIKGEFKNNKTAYETQIEQKRKDFMKIMDMQRQIGSLREQQER